MILIQVSIVSITYKNKIVYYEEFLCTTVRYSLEDKDTVQTYIKTIEEKLGNKLNRETLEIEKQIEFKDGDIVTMHKKNCDIVFIFNRLRTEGLTKEGKAWNSDKKAIVDLKPKVELKPFNKVVVRCNKADKWSIDFFSYKVSNRRRLVWILSSL